MPREKQHVRSSETMSCFGVWGLEKGFRVSGVGFRVYAGLWLKPVGSVIRFNPYAIFWICSFFQRLKAQVKVL